MPQSRDNLIATCLLLAAGFHTAACAEDSLQELLEQAVAAGDRGELDEGVRLATRAIEQDATLAHAYYVRGRERLRAGQVRESVADFDKYIQLRPAIAARQWERGIACYYAGMHEEGAKQFESYQRYHDQDVENSVWRFLCLVPKLGVKRAQATMLAIEDDRRVPMMHIYEMYRGKLQPHDVLAAARAGNPAAEELAGRLFYAHLYLGLWYEAVGDKRQAKQYIDLSADEKLRDNRRINRYMWDVARLHQRLLGSVP